MSGPCSACDMIPCQCGERPITPQEHRKLFRFVRENVRVSVNTWGKPVLMVRDERGEWHPRPPKGKP